MKHIEYERECERKHNIRPQFINYYYLFICMYVTKYENIMFDIEKQKKNKVRNNYDFDVTMCEGFFFHFIF